MKKLFAIIFILAILFFSNAAFAVNTKSIDLENSDSNYLSAIDMTSLDITGDLTMQLWVKHEMTVEDDASAGYIAKYNNTGNQRSYRFYYYKQIEASGLLSISISADGINNTAASVAWTPTIGVWYHLAVVYDASAGSADFYVNGTQQGTTQTGLATSIFNSDATAPLLIGSINAAAPAASTFDGLTDDVRIYNATRTQSNIASDYQQEITDLTNVMAYWKFNDSLNDATTYCNTSTWNYAATFPNPVYSTDIPFGGAVTTVTQPLPPPLPSLWEL